MNKYKIFTALGAVCVLIAMVAYYVLSSISDGMPAERYGIFVVSFLLIWLPVVIELIFKTNFPILFYFAYYAFLLPAHVLGTGMRGYYRYASLDLIMHGSSGVLIALFASYLLKKDINKQSMFKNFFVILGLVCLVGVLWEIYEYSYDCLFDDNTQKYIKDDIPLIGHAALVDTMEDLILDAIGGVIGAVLGIVYYIKQNGRAKVVVAEASKGIAKKIGGVQVSEQTKSVKKPQTTVATVEK